MGYGPSRSAPSSEPPHEKRRCHARRCNETRREVAVSRPGMPHGESDHLVDRVRNGHRADKGQEPPPGRQRGERVQGPPTGSPRSFPLRFMPSVSRL